LDEDLASLCRLFATLGASASGSKCVLLLDFRSISSVICNLLEQNVPVSLTLSGGSDALLDAAPELHGAADSS
jgi:hypothetical protein